METIVVRIMHYIYATSHVGLMHCMKLWTQTFQNLGFFLIFQQKKSNIFVKNQGIENLKTYACSCGCLLAYKTIICLTSCTILKLWTQMCQNWGFFSRISPLFSLIIQILKVQTHGHVGENVCFHIKSSHGWLSIYSFQVKNPNMSKLVIFLDFSAEKKIFH